MDQRVSLITLGVSDLARSRSFYESLGWQSSSAPDGDVVFFQAGYMILGLWGRDQLAEDCGVPLGSGFGGVALAINVASPEDVDVLIAEAQRAGAEITRAAGTTFWGGYTAIFLDPDGHPWEVAHNPGWTLAPDGSVSLTG